MDAFRLESGQAGRERSSRSIMMQDASCWLPAASFSSSGQLQARNLLGSDKGALVLLTLLFPALCERPPSSSSSCRSRGGHRSRRK